MSEPLDLKDSSFDELSDRPLANDLEKLTRSYTSELGERFFLHVYQAGVEVRITTAFKPSLDEKTLGRFNGDLAEVLSRNGYVPQSSRSSGDVLYISPNQQKLELLKKAAA